MDNNVDLLHRLHTDLDHLIERDAWQNPRGREFKERTREQLLRGYQKKHEQALETLEESHGLPLTLEEYARWCNLLNAQADRELYRDVYAYRYLKPLHKKGDVDAFEEALNTNDGVLQSRRLLLIDGYLACVETWLYDQRREGHALPWSEYLEKMDTQVNRAQSPDLSAIWLNRVRVLEAYCLENLEALSDAVNDIGNAEEPNIRESWLKFRYRQTKRLAERAKSALLADILTKLNNFDRDLGNPNYSPAPDALARALEYALMAASMVDQQNAAYQVIQRVLVRCTQGVQLAAVKKYFEDKRGTYLKELATKPVKEMLGKFEELNSQVGRIHRALGRFKKHPDVSVNLNPMLFQEIAEGAPNQQPNRSVRNITEQLRVVAKGVEELREQYVKLLCGDQEAIVGRTTWNFPDLSTEARTADAELDRIAEQNVIYEIDLFERLRTDLDGHFMRIQSAIDNLRRSLDPARRRTEDPLQLYRAAKNHLDAINTEADAVRGLRGYERLLDVGIFQVPDAFMRSSPRVALDEYYNQLEGLKEHKQVVGELVKRAEQWDSWRQRLLRACDDGFALEPTIESWSGYADALYSKLPVSSLSGLDEGLYGSTAEWLNAIQDIQSRPLVDIVELRRVLARDAVSRLPVVLEDVFKAAPAVDLPEDLAHYYGSYAGRAGNERTLGDLVEQDLSQLNPNDLLEEVKRRLQERAEALAEKCQALCEYEAGIKRIIMYLNDAKNGVEVALSDEREKHRPNRDLIRNLEGELGLYNKTLSILEGKQQ